MALGGDFVRILRGMGRDGSGSGLSPPGVTQTSGLLPVSPTHSPGRVGKMRRSVAPKNALS